MATKLAQNQISGPRVHVQDFGAVGDGTAYAGTGTDDSSAIQLAFDYIRDNGGTLEFDATKVYRCDSALTLLANSSTVKDYPYVVNGNGCFLDFTNLSSSGVAVKVGATNINFLNENSARRFGGFTITGPTLVTRPTVAVGTSEGLRVEFGHNCHYHDIYIAGFYKACHKYFTFRDYWTNVRCRNSYIGFWLDSANTQAQYNECSVDQCAHPMVFQPNTDTNGVGSQTFVNLKILNNRGPITLDPGTIGTGNDHRISNISFITPRWEGNGEDKANGDYTDILRIGFAWDSDPTVVGASRDRWIMNTSVINPTFRHSFNVVRPWTTGSTYSQGADDKNASTVYNSTAEVLKCTTAGGGASTVEPTSANAGTTLGDGYVWQDMHDNGRENKFIRATTNKKVIGVICEGCAIDWEQDVTGTMRHIKFTGATQINRQYASTAEVNGVMRFQQWNSDEGRACFDFVAGSEKYMAGNFERVSAFPGQQLGDDEWSTGSVAANSTRRYAGKLYLAINAGTAASGSEPVHISGESTGADGITWRYLGREYLLWGETTLTYKEHLHTAYWKAAITGNSDKGPIHVSNDNGHAKVSRCFITAMEGTDGYIYDSTNNVSYPCENTKNYRPLLGYTVAQAWVSFGWSAGDYVKAAANDKYVYKLLSAGGGSSTVEPTHTDSTGVTESDGYTWAFWRKTEPADWASGATYAVGDRVKGGTGEKWYEVHTVGGGTTSNEPTHTDTTTGTTEADGYGYRYLGTYQNQYDNLRSWNDAHAIVAGELRYNANNLYRALNAGSFGATQPTHTVGAKSDGTIIWQYEGVIRTPSDALCRIDWCGHIGIEATT